MSDNRLRNGDFVFIHNLSPGIFVFSLNFKVTDMKIIVIDQVEKTKVQIEGASGEWKQLPLGSRDGAPVYSYRVFSVEPGANTP